VGAPTNQAVFVEKRTLRQPFTSIFQVMAGTLLLTSNYKSTRSEGTGGSDDKEVNLVRKGLVLATMMVLVCCMCGTALAKAVPQYIPVECYFEETEQYITKTAPQALFNGHWYYGQGSTYSVYINYGDGTYESFNTTSHSDSFFHHYDTAGKEPGYQWTVTLRVTNGNTVYDYATVTLVEE